MEKLDEIVGVELTTGAGSDSVSVVYGTERDIGTAYSGLLILNCEMGSANDISDVHLVTDQTSSLTTADSKATIEAVKYWTTSAPTGQGTDITVSSNQFTIPADSIDVLVIAQVSGLQRYVRLVMKCSAGSAHEVGAVLVCGDSPSTPILAARSAFS